MEPFELDTFLEEIRTNFILKFINPQINDTKFNKEPNRTPNSLARISKGSTNYPKHPPRPPSKPFEIFEIQRNSSVIYFFTSMEKKRETFRTSRAFVSLTLRITVVKN